MRQRTQTKSSLKYASRLSYMLGVAFMIASLFVNLIPPQVASAHAAIVKGVTFCDNGNPTVTWTISNDFNLIMTIVSTSPNIGLNGVTVAASPSQPYHSVSATKTYAGQSGTVTLIVNSKWTDNFSTTNSGSVNLATNCPTPVPPTSVPPTSVPPTSTQPIWDKSSINVSGSCRQSDAVFTITNTGSAMTGSSSYEFYVGGIKVGGGSFTLGAGGSTSVSYPSNGSKVTIIVYQRPGHPGIGSAQADATCGSNVPPTSVPPTSVPPTSVPPTSVPPTSVPPTSVPPTSEPPTSVPPTSVPPTSEPPTSVPPTSIPPTSEPPTSVPPTSVPPTSVPPTSEPPTSVPPTSVPPTSVPPTSVPPTSEPPTSVPPTTVPPDETPVAPTNNPPPPPKIHDPFSLEFYCTGFTVINRNNFTASYEWSISYTILSGTGVLGPFKSASYNTNYYPGVVSVYSGGELMAAGRLPTNCDGSQNTPTPRGTPRPNSTELVKTLIPKVSSTPDILIPVTGVDLGGGNSLQRMFFSMGLGFLGLGFVMNGLSRRRKDLGI